MWRFCLFFCIEIAIAAALCAKEHRCLRRITRNMLTVLPEFLLIASLSMLYFKIFGYLVLVCAKETLNIEIIKTLHT